MSTTGDTRHSVKLTDEQWGAVEELARAEYRSMTNMVQMLLTEALAARLSEEAS